MKALLSMQPGPPESLVLTDVADPAAGDGEVLISIRAAGVNYLDALIIEDRYQLKPTRPFAPGCEVAGVIAAVGAGVAGLKVGDRVVGFAEYGGYAEKIVIRAERCMPIPSSMPFVDAAALTLTYGTSFYALKHRAHLQPSETLLILGAAGGVGIAAIEIGKAQGARVVGAVSSERKAEFARNAGADATIVYPEGKLSKDQTRALADGFKRVCGGGADVIYDAVGGDYCEPGLRSMNWAGRYLVIGFPAGIPAPPLNLLLLKSCSIVGVFWGAALARDRAGHREDMRELFDLYAAAKIRPRGSETFSLAQAGKAIRALKDRRSTGKLVIEIERGEN